jgi:hypothetical protein
MKYRRFFICLLSLFLSSGALSRAEIQPFKTTCISDRSLLIEVTPRLIRFDTIRTTDGTMTLRPAVQNASILDNTPGSPIRLVFNGMIAVPGPAGFTVEKIEALHVRRIPGIMAPSPALRRSGEFSDIVYSQNTASYQTSPEPWVEVKYGGISRNIMSADVTITAARYDAQSQSIEIPEKIRVYITFSTASSTGAFLPASDLPAAILNPTQAVKWAVTTHPGLSKRPEAGQNAGKRVKITIESEGIYRLSASDLSKAGIGIAASDAATIKLYGTGGLPMSEDVRTDFRSEVVEQPLVVNTNPDGSIQEILFYASAASGFERAGSMFRHFVNPYSKTSSYILTSGGAPGLRAVPTTPPAENPVTRPTSYLAHIFNEEEIFNAFDSKGFGSGTAWFGRKFDGSLTFTTPLPNLVREGNTYFRYSIAHRNDLDGVCTVSENGRPLGSLSIYGCDPFKSNNYVDANSTNRYDSIPSTALSSDNRSILKFSYTNNSGASASEALFDWFEIHYPRECVANNGEIELFTDPSLLGIAEYSINGFGQQIYAFDVTDRRNPVMMQNTSSTGGLFIGKADVQQGKPLRWFVSSSFKSPKIEPVETHDLIANFANTDVVVITHKELLESAEKFAAYRKTTGLSAAVVTTEQIYNDFSGGMQDVAAVRNFIGYAVQNWQTTPKYAVLWGDGHYDFKNIQALQTNYLPTHQEQSVSPDRNTQLYDGTMTIAGDDFYARVVGNDAKPDIAIGRVPITSPEVGLWMVDKIKHYEKNPEPGVWQQTVTLIADDGLTGHGNDGTEHSGNSEELSATIIPDDMIQRKVYMAEYATENLPGGRRKPEVTREYLNIANNQGTILMNFVGHGSPRVWAHELVFERETTVPQFTNLNKLFFLTAPTCDFGRFDDPNRNSGAEDLLFSKIGGAIGVFAATRPVYSNPNKEITKAFYRWVSARRNDKYLRLGDVLYEVKQTLNADNDQKFVLLGDPTMRLLLPNYIVRIDSINGQPTTSDTAGMPLVKALSRVVLQASILQGDNQTSDPTFNGRALITMTDSDVRDEVKDAADGIMHTIIRPSGILNRSSFSVQSGKFTATMIVPKDISFSNKQGRLFAFAVDSGKTAKGDSRAFRVGGLELGSFDDITGPEISIFMDSRTFRAGELVRKSPLLIIDLSDETGINTTGMGIGHKIEAWLDNNPTPIDLTEAFQTSVEDSRKGSAEKQIFNLAAGNHTVRARAWDVLNNYSETQTYFRTANSDKELILDRALAFPNPSSGAATLTIIHNQSQPFDAEFSIFAADGRLVKSIGTTVNTLHTASVQWDGRNSDGDLVAQGAYTFLVSATSAHGGSGQLSGMIQISR